MENELVHTNYSICQYMQIRDKVHNSLRELNIDTQLLLSMKLFFEYIIVPVDMEIERVSIDPKQLRQESHDDVAEEKLIINERKRHK